MLKPHFITVHLFKFISWDVVLWSTSRESLHVSCSIKDNTSWICIANPLRVICTVCWIYAWLIMFYTHTHTAVKTLPSTRWYNQQEMPSNEWYWFVRLVQWSRTALEAIWMEVSSFLQAQSTLLSALASLAVIGILPLLMFQTHALISPPSGNSAPFKTFNRLHVCSWGYLDLKERTLSHPLTKM